MPVDDLNDRVVITHGNNTATILKHGATVISWVNNGEEQLWLSQGARLDGSRPVRGGIPLVFPVFGKQKDEHHPTAKLPQHGFARDAEWELLGQTTEDPVGAEFGLAGGRSDWPYKFSLILSVTLANDKLAMAIDVKNEDEQEFDFQWLFHTYLRVPDITDVLVTNLAGQHCDDRVVNAGYTEKAPAVAITGECDRMYVGVEDRTVQVLDKGRVLFSLARKNLPDVVVWNPWDKKAEAMADFAPKQGFHEMICVEPGHAATMVVLPPGGTWSAAQEIAVGGEISLQGGIF
ncbi:uncharacterized protein LODBEIA_P31540 [Lodderomyces beijingensis]|uniref:Glucose-6-phosphate 1-epimerase n=1 Tax=Lodderomyces beijingensis TaxID=1775926 RepID=A0ABP0ZE57_9ASCO